MARLQRALPPREWDAVSLWLRTFYPYQLAWMLDPCRFVSVLKARQVGVSHTFGGASALWGLLGEETTVVSIGERESIEVIDKTRRHAEALVRLGSQWAKHKAKQEGVSFETGGRVVGLPSSSAGRGYSGNIILDEFAYHAKPETVWDGAAAVVMHGHKLRVMSTPNGVGNLFHKLWTDPKASKGYSKHSVTIDEAKADGLRVDDEECWKMARGDPRVYDQLFRCSFLDNDEQYIPSELIGGCSLPDTSQIRGDTYAGLDIGLTNDLTALCVGRIGPDGLPYVQEVETCKRTSWEDQEQMIARSFQRWGWRRMCVDSTGLGAVPSQRLARKYPGRIEAVNFNASVKEDLATRLYQSFAERKVFIPSGDALLRTDICSLRRLVTAAGAVRYDAQRTADGHADRAWALALMLMACTRPVVYRNLTNLPTV
jgi:phage FluMu gp28-like protein